MIPTDAFAFLLVMGTPPTVEAPTEVVSPPTSPSTSRYGGIPGAVQVSWVSGDADAYTRIYVPSSSSFYPYGVAPPAVTAFSTDLLASLSHEFTLTHFKNGQESTGVDVSWVGDSE